MTKRRKLMTKEAEAVIEAAVRWHEGMLLTTASSRPTIDLYTAINNYLKVRR